MKWRKRGLLFYAQGQRDWMHTHAAVPIAEPLHGTVCRIYFSTRDHANRSHTGCLVVDLERPQALLELDDNPILAPGPLGGFDDSGAMATWLTRVGQRRYLYYIGWNLGVTVPFRNAIGLAISDHGEPFRRHALGPIMDRTAHEPHFVASCCVLEDAGLWRNWYLAGTEWLVGRQRPEPRYHIRYAESRDGIHWQRQGHIALDFAGPGETALSRPSVLRDGDTWKMWYSGRGHAYRIGYAESPDGLTWQRQDASVGIEPSVNGWDADMIEYPHVFDLDGRRYMLYNGNGYGLSGFGLAELE
jgi:hypothetical protein